MHANSRKAFVTSILNIPLGISSHAMHANSRKAFVTYLDEFTTLIYTQMLCTQTAERHL